MKLNSIWVEIELQNIEASHRLQCSQRFRVTLLKQKLLNHLFHTIPKFRAFLISINLFSARCVVRVLFCW